jgi:hypothetical protein
MMLVVVVALTWSSIAFCGEIAAEQKTTDQKMIEAPAMVNMDKASYGLGLLTGKDFKAKGIELKPDGFMKGLNDAFSEAKPAMSDKELQQVMTSLRTEIAAKKDAQSKSMVNMDKASYGLGLLMGKDFNAEGIELKPDRFRMGLNDALSEAKPAMSDKELQQVMTSLRTEIAAKKDAQKGELGPARLATEEVAVSGQAHGRGQVRVVPYKDVGWRIPSSGEVIMAKIKSENSFFVQTGTFFLTRVKRGSIVTSADNVYVIYPFDTSLEAGRLAIEPIGGNSKVETENSVSFFSGNSGVRITSLDDKGFVNFMQSVVLPIGTELEIEKMHWQDAEFDKGIITLRADGLEWISFQEFETRKKEEQLSFRKECEGLSAAKELLPGVSIEECVKRRLSCRKECEGLSAAKELLPGVSIEECVKRICK